VFKFVPPSGYIGGGVIAGTPPASGDNQAIAGSTLYGMHLVTSDEILGRARKDPSAINFGDGRVNTLAKRNWTTPYRPPCVRGRSFTVGIGDNFYSGVDKGSVEQISERTGGRAYFPRDESEPAMPSADQDECVRNIDRI